MVYLSELTVDPLRARNLQLLGDTYEMHRWIWRAFPDAEQGGAGRVLYRVERERRPVRILVQSDREPDWRACEDLLEGVRGPREFCPDFKKDSVLRFRLRANPIVKKNGKRLGLKQPQEQLEWLERKGVAHGFEVVPLPRDWFDPFAGEPEPRAEVRIVPLNHLVGNKRFEQQEFRIEHLAVDFDGVLRVTDPDRFSVAIRSGVGAAKGLGFGLLSVSLLK